MNQNDSFFGWDDGFDNSSSIAPYNDTAPAQTPDPGAFPDQGDLDTSGYDNWNDISDVFTPIDPPVQQQPAGNPGINQGNQANTPAGSPIQPFQQAQPAQQFQQPQQPPFQQPQHPQQQQFQQPWGQQMQEQPQMQIQQQAPVQPYGTPQMPGQQQFQQPQQPQFQQPQIIITNQVAAESQSQSQAEAQAEADADAAAVAVASPQVPVQRRSRLVAILLCLFFGYLGAHRFYLGMSSSAIKQILSIFVLIGFFWVPYDLIRLIFGGFPAPPGVLV